MLGAAIGAVAAYAWSRTELVQTHRWAIEQIGDNNRAVGEIVKDRDEAWERQMRRAR